MSKRLPSTAFDEAIKEELAERNKRKMQDWRDARVRAKNRLNAEEKELKINIENLKWEKKRLEDENVKLKVERAREEGLKEGKKVAQEMMRKDITKKKPTSASSSSSYESVEHSPVLMPSSTPFFPPHISHSSTIPFPIPYPTPPYSTSYYSTPISSFGYTNSSASSELFSNCPPPSIFLNSAPLRSTYYEPVSVNKAIPNDQNPPTYIPTPIVKFTKKTMNPIKNKHERPLPYWEDLRASIQKCGKYGKRLFENPKDGLCFDVHNYSHGAVRVKIGNQWHKL